jgi:hypothetical protein
VKLVNPTKRTVVLGMVVLFPLLAACQPTVNLGPAEFANSPECANMTVRLPETVAEQPRRSVNAQATGAWGAPVAVIVRCGLALPEPSPLPCVTVDGIDWLRDDTDAPRFRFTTYGLNPATEVIVDSEVVSGTSALRDLSKAVGSQSAPVQACIDPAGALD